MRVIPRLDPGSLLEADDIEAGRLERVLPRWSGGAMPIVALFASRRNQPRKLRVFLDAMATVMRSRAGGRL